MTNEQQNYIKNNTKLINSNDWEEFFNNAPDGIGTVLYEAGINFLEELDHVPQNAFMNSTIQQINIPDSIRRIDKGAFCGCKGLTSIVIPNGVTSIGKLAFHHCDNLISIMIPNSVTIIDPYAFCSCGKLKINYDGTKEEWRELIKAATEPFVNTTYTCNCIDGVVKKSR